MTKKLKVCVKVDTLALAVSSVTCKTASYPLPTEFLVFMTLYALTTF